MGAGETGDTLSAEGGLLGNGVSHTHKVDFMKTESASQLLGHFSVAKSDL